MSGCRWGPMLPHQFENTNLRNITIEGHLGKTYRIMRFYDFQTFVGRCSNYSWCRPPVCSRHLEIMGQTLITWIPTRREKVLFQLQIGINGKIDEIVPHLTKIGGSKRNVPPFRELDDRLGAVFLSFHTTSELNPCVKRFRKIRFLSGNQTTNLRKILEILGGLVKRFHANPVIHERETLRMLMNHSIETDVK